MKQQQHELDLIVRRLTSFFLLLCCCFARSPPKFFHFSSTSSFFFAQARWRSHGKKKHFFLSCATIWIQSRKAFNVCFPLIFIYATMQSFCAAIWKWVGKSSLLGRVYCENSLFTPVPERLVKRYHIQA